MIYVSHTQIQPHQEKIAQLRWLLKDGAMYIFIYKLKMVMITMLLNVHTWFCIYIYSVRVCQGRTQMQNEQGEYNLLITMGTQKDEAGRQSTQ